MRLISRTFRSLKRTVSGSKSSLPARRDPDGPFNKRSNSKLWCVYLILSTNSPIKTYVGVTTNFTRRLKQHNGEIKGGAKASRAGRPWVCACLIKGFRDQSQAYQFESMWKSTSKKLPYIKTTTEPQKQVDDSSFRLLQHRKTALDKVKGLLDCCDLNFDWKLNPC